MKKSFLLIVVFCFLIFRSGAQCVVNIPDANFKAALLEIPGIDANSNGEIECSEASSFTGDIDVSDKVISDLTGIEAFINITRLNCSNNRLLNLNVSSNLAIKYLNFAYNFITEIELSMFDSLIDFVATNNRITSLDFSQNFIISAIYCERNLLNFLNVKNGNNSNIGNFFATNNPDLNCIQVDDPAYSATRWFDIDPGVSFSTYCAPPLCVVNIPDANFKAALLAIPGIDMNSNDTIECSEASSFTGDIDVSDNNIYDLSGIEAFTAITYLNCSQNNLSFLNINSNVNLQTLICNDNAITNINLNGLSDLIDFDCSNNQLTALDVTQALNLRNFYCDDNDLSELDVANNIEIINLECSHNSLQRINLSSLGNLNRLVCDYNQLKNLDVSYNSNVNYISCNQNLLYTLRVNNGNNNSIDGTGFNATNNPNLSCIEVDDPVYSESNWTNIDAGTTFSISCPYSCIVNIPDANFKSALLEIPGIDINEDGEIQCPEATGYTGYINVFNSSIMDLTGIESFVNITELDCSENDLVNLNVTSNTALYILKCYNNALTDLDVSSNLNLQHLNCGSNSLTQLNISGLNALIQLYCWGNELTNLDFSENLQLEEIICGNNLLTQLDVTQNNGLWYLSCSNNLLTQLDVTQNNRIKFLYCDNNLLTELNISGLYLLDEIYCNNNQLATLDCSANNALRYLYCNDNLLTELNITGLTNLSTIECNNNQLTDLNVSTNSNLQSLYCNDNSLTVLNVRNGNNTSFYGFNATNNPDLTCIQVDDAAYSTAYWRDIDPWASFSAFCAGGISWTGNSSGDWSEESNWSTGVVPVSTDDVLIPSGTTYSPIVNSNVSSPAVCNNLTIEAGATVTVAAGKALTLSGVTINSGTLTIESDASGTGSLLHHNNNLPAIFEQYIAMETWNLISSPFQQGSGAAAGDLIPAGGEAYLRPYNDGIGWGSYITQVDDELESLKGYSLWLTAPKTVRFSGLLNNGTIDRQLITGPTNNWNLTGNPYPSSIDWNLLDRANTTESIYLWDNDYAGTNSGNYMTYNASSGIGVPASVTGIVPPFQGFFVEATTDGFLQFTNDARLHSDQQLYRRSTGLTEVLLRLKVTDAQNSFDELVVCTNPGATNNFDAYDSKKLPAESDAPEIYSVCQNEPLVINTIMVLPEVIPVNIKTPALKAGNYTLNAFDMISNNGITIQLEDTYLNTLTDLRTYPVNIVNLAGGLNDNRFFLHLGSTAGITENDNPALVTFVNDINIYVSFTGDLLMTKLSLFDMTGREIFSQNCINNRSVIGTENLAKGVYIVKAYAGKTTATTKVNIY